jgi:hypothetical protein
MKTFKEFIVEISHGDTVYRGHESNHDDKHINWYSASHDLANQYAADRKSPYVEISKAKSKKPINLGHDRLSVGPSDILHHATNQHETKDFGKEHHDAYNKFRDHFGKHDRNITEFWNNDKNKEHTHEFLKKFGYDSIRIREGKHEHETLGVLK